MIPYSTQNISKDDVKAVMRALTSGWLTQGPAIESFEKALAKKVGARYAVAFNSGTAALHAAYFAAGLKKGDEVLLPALTFAATANAALYLDASPVFVDSNLLTGNIGSNEIERKITKRTKILVLVDYAGRPADLTVCRKIARKHNLVLIEDGAQSLGAFYKQKAVGTQADMTMFSFHPVKSITTGEGGIICTNSLQYLKALKLFRSHGISKDPSTFTHTHHAEWYQEMQALGFNYRMTDIQAALGESQLSRLDSFIEKRKKAADRYHALLKDIPGILLPPEDTKDIQSAWHLYPIRLDTNLAPKRDHIFSLLRRAGIGVQVHYLPVYHHVYYEKLGFKKGLCPNTELFAATEISLPLFPDITKGQQDKVVKELKRAISA